MSLVLKERLRKGPIFFSALPPPRRASPSYVYASIERLQEGLSRLPRVCAVNLPEIVDENHLGLPFYRTYDPRVFSQMIRKSLDIEAVVNKVVVHLHSHGDFLRWAKETVSKYEVHNIVLVGGSSHLRKYPGPNVLEAEGILSHLFHSKGIESGISGCVTIPSRDGEAERLFAKTLAGAFFATTQILYDTRAVKNLLLRYDALCRTHGVEPATVLLSFAPIHDDGDLEFVRWLGIDIPESVESSVLSDGDDSVSSSIKLAMRLYREVLLYTRRKHIRVPLGVNVEEVSRHNIEAALELASQVSKSPPPGA